MSSQGSDGTVPMTDPNEVTKPSATSSTHGGLIRWLVRWFVRAYYGKIEVTGAERIPRSGPVLLCANHPNSLIDPVMVGLASRRAVRFMAKAPLFDTPVLGPIMTALGMVPAFRAQDDSSQVRRNIESLDTGAHILAGGHAMGIFPEGKSHDEPTIEQVRSGAARMATKAVELGARGLVVVPVGLNYERKERFKSAVWIRVGEPIDVDRWIAQHDGDTRAAMRSLTVELDKRLKESAIHLDEPQWASWLEDLDTLAPSPEKSGGSLAGVAALQRRKRIADAINHFMAVDRPRAESVAGQIAELRQHARSAGLDADSRILRRSGARLFGSLTGQILCLLAALAPAILATLHHLVPFLLVRELAARVKPPGNTTTAFYRLLFAIPIYGLWYVLVAWWMFDYFAAWFAAVWIVSMPAAGLVAAYFWRHAGEAMSTWWHQIVFLTRRERLRRLREERSRVQETLGGLAREYAALVPLPERPRPPSRWRRALRAGLWVAVAGLLFLAGWFARPWLLDGAILQGGGPAAGPTWSSISWPSSTGTSARAAAASATNRHSSRPWAARA